MPTLLQFSSFFNVFGSALVVALSIVALRLRPSPFFRSWVYSYAWSTVMTFALMVEVLMGRSFSLYLLSMAALVPALWWQLRMGYELRGRAFSGRAAAAGLVLVPALGVALLLGGAGHDAAVVPGPLAIMAVLVWLGALMIRMGRTPEYAGMGWVGVPVVFQGLWLVTYPVLQGTPWFWVGFGVAALTEVGVGIGMVVFVLVRTARQLELAEQRQREFLNAASHELRTPLTSIMGYAELLEEPTYGPLSERNAFHAAQIRKGAGRLGRIVDDMLDYACLEAGEFGVAPQPLDVRGVVRAEVESLLPQSRDKAVDLQVTLPAEPLMAQADAQRVGQTVLNLVGNALKYTPAGGTVRVAATAAGGEVRVEVRDDGIGIDASHLPHLFQKYYRVDWSSTRQHGGAGLGLPICRALVEAQGGRIGVETRPGQGSTFWFTLPAAPGLPAS